MKKPQEEYVSVWRLAETDGWDGVAAVGIYHCHYLHVAQVLREEDGGWWDDCQPYLVFTNVPFADKQAGQAVERALEGGQVGCTMPWPLPARERDPTRPTLCVNVSQRFDAVARAGMRAGFAYSQVACAPGRDAGTVALAFYNDERDVPGDDLDIDSVIDLL